MKILLNLLSIINIIIFIKKSTSTHSASSINTTNICIRNQNECKGIYDQFNLSYRVHCEKKACDNHFNFACNSFYCTRDKETCRKILNIEYQYYLDMIKKDVYIKFVSSVNNCEKKIYHFHKNDICQNGLGCTIKSNFYYRNFEKEVPCPCIGSHTYSCENNDYCAINQMACIAFIKSYIRKSNEKQHFIKGCNNGNKVLKNNYLRIN